MNTIDEFIFKASPANAAKSVSVNTARELLSTKSEESLRLMLPRYLENAAEVQHDSQTDNSLCVIDLTFNRLIC